MEKEGLQRLQTILKKVERGDKLSPKEAKFFERLKGDYGLSDTGTIKTVMALAKVLGVSRKTIYQWKKEPGFPIEPDGNYDPEKIAAWRGQGNNGQVEVESGGVSNKVFWDTEFRKFRAKLSEVSYRKEKGELIPRKEVEALLVDRAIEFKKALLSRGRRLSLRLAYKDSQECQRILEEDSLQILYAYSRPNSITKKGVIKKKRKAKSVRKKS